MLSLDAVGTLVRSRGLLQPRSIAEDVLAVALVTTAVVAVYVDLARKRDAGNPVIVSVSDQGFEGHVSNRGPGERLLRVAQLMDVMLYVGFRDSLLLASGPFIFWYGARFLLFGVRWGVNSTFAMAGPVLAGITPSRRWVFCPSNDRRECDLRFCHPSGVGDA